MDYLFSIKKKYQMKLSKSIIGTLILKMKIVRPIGNLDKSSIINEIYFLDLSFIKNNDLKTILIKLKKTLYMLVDLNQKKSQNFFKRYQISL